MKLMLLNFILLAYLFIVTNVKSKSTEMENDYYRTLPTKLQNDSEFL